MEEALEGGGEGYGNYKDYTEKRCFQPPTLSH